ncbi:MAG: RNA polymerase sigma factor [Betaproteobacteria bacterium]|nr:RNA polymerase sigma factor [Betaproteobacteria bacterium]
MPALSVVLPSGEAVPADRVEPSDEDLMQRFGAGDAGAFDALYARHRGPMFRFMQRQCANRALAEELFQDVWMSLIAARERYRQEAKFTTYLYTLARHRVIDHFRRQGVRSQVHAEGDEDSIELAPSAAPTPEAQLESRRAVSRVLDLVEALPSAQREVMLLRAEAGLSIEEIAAVTLSERETVKSRLRYAMDKLKRGMEGWL